MIKARVNAKNVSVRRLAGLVIPAEPCDLKISEEQFAVLAKDEFVSVVKLEEESGAQEPVVFGKKASEYTADDLAALRAQAKGKGNTKEGRLAKELIKKLEEEAGVKDGE